MPDPDPTRSPSPDAPATPSGATPAVTRPGSGPAATVRATVTPARADAPLPMSVGRYELGEEIARGGMGAVYRATDTAFGREVAVKVLLDRFDTRSGSARRFADEARITGQLQHPAIPPVHDLGVLSDGRPFLAMKLIKGETLDELLRARPDPSAERGRFVAVFEQVCQALAYAHAHNVIHRDLKPANVMVGNFGEVQVMDWGLTKVLGTREADAPDPDEATGGTAIQSRRESDGLFTQAGSVLGTPAYMPPEQAIGAINKIDTRSDVFGLGAILAVILTGQPPFAASSVETTLLQAAQGNVEECFVRLDTCGGEPELVSLCKRCLSKKPGDRPAHAGEVARAVAALRAAADERARQAELERVKAEGDKAAADARAEEQRNRRRVQLILAAVVVAALTGAGIAAALVIEQRAADKLAAEQKQSEERVAAEKKLADERFAAEQKRQSDLKAADAAAREKQRQTRAEALVRALATADTAGVSRVVADLAEVRDLTGARLRELSARPVTEKPGLHARMAILSEMPERAVELAAYLPGCKADELVSIRDALKPHAAAVAPVLWAVLTDPKSDSGHRVRAGCALAGLTPSDERWPEVSAAVAVAAVGASPDEFAVWAAALDPVRGVLVGPLMERYLSARAEIRSGKLSETGLAAAISGYEFTAVLLARYTERPADLAELAMSADPRHFARFAPTLRAKKAEVVPLLKAEVEKKPPEQLSMDKLDAALQALGKRRGYAAAALVALGEGESVWSLFRFPADGDPTARSYLIERLAAVGNDPLSLMQRWESETDVSAKRALIVTLGDFPLEMVPGVEREALAAKLLVAYREHPDSGLHSALDWLLRQKWDKAKELATIDAELTAQARGRAAVRAVPGAVPVGAPPLPVGPLLPAPAVAEKKDWFVNSEGLTFAVVRGPVEFTLGSPESEPGREAVNEPAHRKRIGRTFAIATKEVTVEQFLRFRPKHDWVRRFSPGPDTPVVMVRWYDGAAYCNWLSAREGIPPDQWCYEPNKVGEYGEGMRMKTGHLSLTGYRLPTESEWEFACRGGVTTSRYYGRGTELLPRYAWFKNNSDDHAWPVGRLRPNERGLFDALGNTLEWCDDPGWIYTTSQLDDFENVKTLLIDERSVRVLRGGSYIGRPAYLRCAERTFYFPRDGVGAVGFRPVRTLP